jgi:hypothetical protein
MNLCVQDAYGVHREQNKSANRMIGKEGGTSANAPVRNKLFVNRDRQQDRLKKGT